MARQTAAWAATIDRPAARRWTSGAPACESATWPASSRAGILRQSKALSGSAVTRKKTPNPRNVSRQPTVSLKCRNTGGQIVPPILSPAVTIPTARPRRRSNQRMMLMDNGP